ncbi:MAG: MarC family protein [Bdellovibrionales bacterium]|nr:MarC family protein [Bdellovibrionales bacterium]
MDFVEKMFLSLIPLFVAIDPPGNMPIFMSMTDQLPEVRRRRLLKAAVLTAAGVALVFLVSGRLIFQFLGITDNDFRIGGGIVLLVFSVKDLLFSSSHSESEDDQELGVVPLGVPLIMGPAALTTIIIQVESQGTLPTLGALAIVLLVSYFLFDKSRHVLPFIGKGGAKAFAKIASLFLAAISVNMIRIGIQNSFFTK